MSPAICPVALALTLSALLAPSPVASAQPSNDLSRYFGFDPMEVLVVTDGFGPVAVGDLNNDGLNDLVIVNNRKSRIDLHYQRRSPDDLAKETPDPDTNEFEPLWRFRHEQLTTAHQIDAIALLDFNHDGRLDLIYAGQPSELVLMSQSSPGVFEITSRRRVRDLSANRNGLLIANLVGDDSPELVCLVKDAVHLYPLNDRGLGDPQIRTIGTGLLAFFCDDYTGDGKLDLLAVLPDNPAPLRLCVGVDGPRGRELSAEFRFEMPALREVEPLHLPGESTARLAVIERVSRRIVLYDVDRRPVDSAAEIDVPLTVRTYPETSTGTRDVEVIDVDGDGLLDVLAADRAANTILLYRQQRDRGLADPLAFPTLAEPVSIAAGNIDNEPSAELIVASASESVVGRCDFESDAYSFPTPLPIENDLVFVDLVRLPQPTVAVVTRDKRIHRLRLMSTSPDDTNAGPPVDVDLGSLPRSPESILAWDADQDGRVDLLVLTPGESPMMLHRNEDGTFNLLTKEKMGQSGLVSAAAVANIALLDIDGDGPAELLLADRNYIRALRYVADARGGAAAGWQVVEQFNVADPRSKLVALADRGTSLAAYDEAGSRICLIDRADGKWRESRSLRLEGFKPSSIRIGSFTGDGAENILCIGADGLGVVRLSGERFDLHEFASFRSDKDDRSEHEISTGDVNGDGFADLVVLDAGEQMLEIFTLSRARRLLQATEFEVFQSRLFDSGPSYQLEPRDAVIADVTGDGAADLLVLVHDRILIYPQSILAPNPHKP